MELVAVVLAAGLGTRLRPLTDFLPKALCPVNNVALVDRALAEAATVASAVAVNIHHHRALLEPHLEGRAHLSVEQEPLGTAGALGALRDWIDGRDVVLLNADTWHEGSLQPLVTGWDRRGSRLLVHDDVERADFEGRWRYIGRALMPWEEVARLEPKLSGLYGESWAPLLERGLLDLVPTTARAIDCGTPKDYLRANLAASGGRNVVGEGAVIEGHIERCVVWPHGHVGATERLVEVIRVGDDITVPG